MTVRGLHGRYVLGRRARVLKQHLADMMPRNATVLDVGCGDGLIDRLILEERPDLSIQGIDIALRPEIHIPAIRFDGNVIPHPDMSFDVVTLVDVLHHTADPMVLLTEARRVARKHILIKDHNCAGFAAAAVLRFMDWVGNAPHHVVLTYNYWPEKRWREAFAELNLRIADYRTRLGLYPRPACWIFERSMHFIVCLDVGA